MDNHFITHYGTPGMKWGVRRYQNEDGSLTSLGKRRNKAVTSNLNTSKRILDSSAQIARGAKQLNENFGGRKANAKVRKDLKNMSDNDLRARVNRMNLERQYSDLTANQVSRGRASLSSILESVGGALGIASSAVGIAVAIRELKKLPTK